MCFRRALNDTPLLFIPSVKNCTLSTSLMRSEKLLQVARFPLIGCMENQVYGNETMVEHDPGLKSAAEKQPSNKPYERWNRQT